MCGISGCFARSGLDPRRFYAAHATLRHRGPDDEGLVGGAEWGGEARQFSGEGTQGRWTQLPDIRQAGTLRWVLGQHRLSILDLSENGHGPMRSPDGRLWLTYNGEVYNYRELREQLTARGHSFATGTDTEVVLHAFAEWGTDCFARFNGMWALALYDAEAGRLVLSRDRFGVKPLLYSLGPDGLLLGSEPKFFRGLMPLHVNERAAAEYLAEARVDHREETFYEEVHQLPPAHYGVYDAERNELRISPYWELPRNGGRSVSLGEAVAEFTELFDSAVDLRMRSDVPVGGLLSGGLDSTAIVRNLDHRGKLDAHGFHTFSAVYEEEEFSERRYVDRAVAGRDRLIPHLVTVGAEEAAAGLNDVIRVQDSPFRSVAVYCQRRLYQTVRASSPAVVLLNGQGADECFGGYTAHYHALLASHLMHGRLAGLARDGIWFARNRDQPARRVLENSAYRLSLALRDGGPVRRRTVTHPCLSPGLELGEPVHDRDPFEDLLRTNLRFSALPEYLRYEDRNSMASSLETRLPFLDYRLVEWAFTLPPALKIVRGETKRVVRRATAPYVPAEIAGRTDKMGFTSPQEVWQRDVLEPWVREGVARVELGFSDRGHLLAAYERGNEGDGYFWFRAACLGWWQELLCS